MRHTLYSQYHNIKHFRKREQIKELIDSLKLMLATQVFRLLAPEQFYCYLFDAQQLLNPLYSQ